MAKSIIDTICSVQHVSKCRVVEELGEITQVFVEADLSSIDQEEPTQQIKSMVRSIVGVLAIHHNLDLDYRKVKVIEYKPDETSATAEPDFDLYPRIQIASVYQRRLPKLEMVVELYCLKRQVIGVAPCTGNLHQDTLSACLNALNQLGHGDLKPLFIQELKNEFNHERAVLVKLAYEHPNSGQEQLMGVAEIRDDLLLAIVKAVLSAVNRRFVVAYPN